MFETEYPQKNYCTTRCRVAEKNARGYEKVPKRPSVVSGEGEKFENPTTEVLAAYAFLHSSGARKDGTVFCGVLPEWTPPAGVCWTWNDEEHTERIMYKAPVDPFMEAVLAQNAQQIS